MRLLLAEDEEAMSEALTDILSYHKYLVDAVFDGEVDASENDARLVTRDGLSHASHGICEFGRREHDSGGRIDLRKVRKIGRIKRG